jgi:hypothetical protein
MKVAPDEGPEEGEDPDEFWRNTVEDEGRGTS